MRDSTPIVGTGMARYVVGCGPRQAMQICYVAHVDIFAPMHLAQTALPARPFRSESHQLRQGIASAKMAFYEEDTMPGLDTDAQSRLPRSFGSAPKKNALFLSSAAPV